MSRKKKWIQDIKMEKGKLHEDLGIPDGEKIPLEKIERAAKKGEILGHRARLALTLKKMGHHVRQRD